MINGTALEPKRFELVIRATERAACIVQHTSVSLGSALDHACRNLGIVLDDDSYCMAIVSLGKYRSRLQANGQNSNPRS